MKYSKALRGWGRWYAHEGRKVFLLTRERLPFRNCAECRDACRSPEDKETCACLFCHGFYAATSDPLRIEEMVDQQPDSALAIRTGACSDLVVIDIDIKDQRGGLDSFRPWLHQFPVLANTRQTVTASGGIHVWLRHPEQQIRNSQSRLGKGIDVRGDGGYVIAPPTITDDNRSYRFDPSGAHDWPVLTMPEALLIALTAEKPRARAIAAAHAENADPARLIALTMAVAHAGEGERNGLLYWAAVRAGEAILAHGWDEQDVIDQLTQAALHAGLRPSEIARTIDSGLRESGLSARRDDR